MSVEVKLTVNGTRRTVATDPERPLLDVLREDLGLTGAKYGCGEGVCGACTVLVDGEPVRSCITPAADAAGKRITTIEGLAKAGRLHPVQAAFAEDGVLQCGYCAPGMILATVALLRRKPRPTDDEIIEALDGHLCRCCTYPTILAAIRKAAGRR
ncbi:MAG: (2Fe-2S)-binding protein [Armatimonadetes bacterium]|nr:(2Fe-2S)-binding protein [Armatimonadota bacterium]